MSKFKIIVLIGCSAFLSLLTLLKPASAGFFDERQLLESKESLYNNIYVYKHGSYVSLTFGYNNRIYTESSYNIQDASELPLTYTRFMTTGLIYSQRLLSILEIGFGGGRTAWYLHRALPNVVITSVELDPEVIRLARKYFGVHDDQNFTVENKDGRLFLTQSKTHYDIIMIDAYRGPFVPFHLLTKEFYQLVCDHIADGGVVVQNVEPSTMLFDSAVATIRTVFAQTEFFPADGNVVTVAYNGRQRSDAELARIANQRQAEFHLRYDLSVMLRQRSLLPPSTDVVDPSAQILTDDFAPVETLQAIERHNRKWPNNH